MSASYGSPAVSIDEECKLLDTIKSITGGTQIDAKGKWSTSTTEPDTE